MRYRNCGALLPGTTGRPGRPRPTLDPLHALLLFEQLRAAHPPGRARVSRLTEADIRRAVVAEDDLRALRP